LQSVRQRDGILERQDIPLAAKGNES